eukprot:CAMPEP_0196764254 /NCGR_PEP_ID=MMETSP1095-20130614/5756_1 /TAXON_ID=96789 ORGANISM="Chromulina nebulosa, Strain UTEXLB2642" /NCGR_SAMPLE_ID=MMETSP1095 /ASSEMBLY_ACC=CAM_ASM_000446 /LENGTH=30 /DNA_ID= /DNA_START= /DNA_END= /DNA_ORIENTATION=
MSSMAELRVPKGSLASNTNNITSDFSITFR